MLEAEYVDTAITALATPPPGRRLAMFRQIAALSSDDPLLGWIWAGMEQERLWLAHDAHWLDQARAGWPDDSIYEMLTAYGLLRGKLGSQLAKVPQPGKAKDTPEKRRQREQVNQEREANRAHFARLAATHARQLVPGDAITNTAIWQAFGHELSAHCGGTTNGGWYMPSATLKAMWFHRPDIVPMYDRFAATGLVAAGKPTTDATNQDDFLARVYALLDQSRQEIAAMRELIESTYPYNIRIVDKFLWLRGNENRQTILDRFQSGCGAMA